jgi:AcrR family transcriptional regulator
MDKEKTVREPKQARSINTKERILDTAYRMFCEKGYYKTTTNEIAKAAGISIGSLYSYFKDKDTIFMEILERYHMAFVSANEKMKQTLETIKPDVRSWLREMIESLIQLHEIGKELNHEVQILCYTNPEVAAVEEQHMEQTRKIAFECFQLMKDDINYDDIEAAAMVAYDMTSSIVDRVVFGRNDISRERIIRAGVEALYRFLVSETYSINSCLFKE